MKKTTKISKSELQTQKIGENLGKNLKGGNIVALYGDLGAGKTVFVKGIAKGLGIKKRILSPTFVFVRSYPLTVDRKPLTFYHVDLYRGQSFEDFEALGLEELFFQNNIVVLEWAGKIAKMLPQKRIDINFKKEDEKTRRITVTFPVIASVAKQSHIVRVKSRTSHSVIPSPAREIRKAAEILKNGGVVIFPTDTVYGIGCRFDDSGALDRIDKIKSRPSGQPFPILVSSVKQVESIAAITPTARELIQKYWPGGLTIILPSVIPASPPVIPAKAGIHPNPFPVIASATKQSQKIGFRMPRSSLISLLIDLVGVPIIGTSANFHGQRSAASFEKLDPKLIKLADFIIKGKSGGGIESTVVDATTDSPKILRQGAVKIST